MKMICCAVDLRSKYILRKSYLIDLVRLIMSYIGVLFSSFFKYSEKPV